MSGPGGFANQPGVQPGVAVMAPGANRSGLVLFLGMSLIFATMVADPAFRAVFTSIVDAGHNKVVVPPTPGTANLWDVGIQIAFVLALTGVAAVNEEAGTIAVTLLVGLWLVFLVMRVDVITAFITFLSGRG